MQTGVASIEATPVCPLCGWVAANWAAQCRTLTTIAGATQSRSSAGTDSSAALTLNQDVPADVHNEAGLSGTVTLLDSGRDSVKAVTDFRNAASVAA